MEKASTEVARMMEQRANLYTCWCGKPRNLELHFCKEHGFLEDKLKQARAEVMASVKAVLAPLLDRLQQLSGDEDLDEAKLQDASEGLLPELHDAILKLPKLQPAAKDLEALLQEARRNGQLKEALRWFCLHERITELEKASAEGRKVK